MLDLPGQRPKKGRRSMPLNDYKCPKGHTTEYWHQLSREVTPWIECPQCGQQAMKLLSAPKFALSWARPLLDNPKEIWADTPLEGTDGINELTYKSDKIQVDLGK